MFIFQHGVFNVFSEGEGKGSTFIMEIPMRRKADASTRNTATTMRKAQSGIVRLLSNPLLLLSDRGLDINNNNNSPAMIPENNNILHENEEWLQTKSMSFA